MKQYQLSIKGIALRQINALAGNYRQRIRRLIAQLSQNPRPTNAKELRNFEGRYRVRVDNYCIVYRVKDDILLIEVLKVGEKRQPHVS